MTPDNTKAIEHSPGHLASIHAHDLRLLAKNGHYGAEVLLRVADFLEVRDARETRGEAAIWKAYCKSAETREETLHNAARPFDRILQYLEAHEVAHDKLTDDRKIRTFPITVGECRALREALYPKRTVTCDATADTTAAAALGSSEAR